MLPEVRLPTEDEYIIYLYRFYFTTGLGHAIISIFMFLDLLGLSEFDYANFYETSYVTLLFSMVYGFIPFLFFLPFLVKLVRYSRKNKWLSFPILVWLSQFLFASLSPYSEFFTALALMCFVVYGFTGMAAGIHGIKQMRVYQNLTLRRK